VDTSKYKLKLFGNKDLPSYLLEKNNVVRIIVFTTAYSLLFINIFKPFNSESWIPNVNAGTNYLMYSSLMVLIGMVVVSLSRMLMGYVTKRVQIGYGEYVLWLIGEAVFVSVFYVFVGYAVGFIDRYLEEMPELTMWEAIFNIFTKSIANTFWMLLIPYIIALLYLDNANLRKRIEDLGGRKMESSIIHLKDERGEIKLSTNIENILYAESADNYVIIKYINGDKMMDFLLRTNLKKLSDDMRDTPLQRCHRSYMINLLHVMSLKKDASEFVIQFDTTSIKNITVSKSYQDSIMDAFTKFQR